MLQVYLVHHGETRWNTKRHIQGQSDSPLAARGEQQAMQMATRAKELSITHIINSDLGRTRRTAEIIAQACGCDIIFDFHLCELDMSALERRHIDSLTKEEENWCRWLVNGIVDGRIPGGGSIQGLNDRINAALESCRDLPQGSQSLLVNHDIILGYPVSMVLGLPA